MTDPLVQPAFTFIPYSFRLPTKIGWERRCGSVCLSPPSMHQLRSRVAPPAVQSLPKATNRKHNKVEAVSQVVKKNKTARFVALPQTVSETDYILRQARIERARDTYRWSQEHISDAALIDKMPERELPSRRWVVKVKRVEDRCEKNRAELSDMRKGASERSLAPYPLTGDRIQSHNLATEEGDDAEQLAASSSHDLFQSYKDQFIGLQKGTVTRENQFLNDDVFGWYRIAGPNPMQIRACKQSDLRLFAEFTDEMFQSIDHFAADALRDSLEENRLFIVDYPELADVSSSEYLSKQKPRQFNYAPTALFAVPRDHDTRASLLPLAIRCGRDGTFPLYTASEKFTDPIAWLAAKVTVQVADAMVHEVIYHFARTHLLLEVFVCATNRSLSDEHPLYVLLNAHFEGTAFINNNSLRTLVSPGGIIDQLTASDIKDTQRMAANGLRGEFSFNACMPDVELQRRGVLQEDTPLDFPYRDDALELWDCILEWSRSYVGEVYNTDKDVESDYELEMWTKELIQNGGLQGFGETPGGGICTRAYLSRAVAMVIFSASVQHAAVNFPQSTMMNFSPAMPLCGYCEAPKEERPFESMEELVEKMMPGLEYAETQMYAAELLGVVRHTKLGEYGKSLSFGGPGLQKAAGVFKARLSVIGERIEKRNEAERAAGLPEYNYLVPKNIPQSTNI